MRIRPTKTMPMMGAMRLTPGPMVVTTTMIRAIISRNTKICTAMRFFLTDDMMVKMVRRKKEEEGGRRRKKWGKKCGGRSVEEEV